MAWTLFLANLITWGPAAVAYGIFLLIATSARSLSAILALAVSSYILNIALAISFILALFTIYAYPAVTVGKFSGLRAIRSSFRTAGQNLGVTFTYALVRGLFQALLLLIVLFAGYIGLSLSSFSAAILTLILTPILHSTKTMIYYYSQPDVPEQGFQYSLPIWQDIGKRLPIAAWRRIRAGLVEAARFIINPRNVPFHILSVSAFLIGIFLGIYVSSNGVSQYLVSLGYQPGHINPLVLQSIPPVLGLDIFLNNWLVSIATGLAGLGFGIPSFATILFNGFILGVLVPLSPTLIMLYAAILPHGIIEIPSFIIAGSIGMKLGYAAWKTWIRHDSESHEYLSRILRQTVFIVVGLAPVFLVAGLIEADVTPVIMRMFGWK
jgi:stage II sporulation protein M